MTQLVLDLFAAGETVAKGPGARAAERLGHVLTWAPLDSTPAWLEEWKCRHCGALAGDNPRARGWDGVVGSATVGPRCPGTLRSAPQ